MMDERREVALGVRANLIAVLLVGVVIWLWKRIK